MRKFNSITIELFEYPTEQRRLVEQALSHLFSNIDYSAEESRIESYYGPEIKRIEVTVKKQQEITALLSNVLMGLPAAEKKQLAAEAKKRIDHEGAFHFRISKQHLVDGQVRILDSGDIVKIKVRAATYPASPEKALRIIEEVFK